MFFLPAFDEFTTTSRPLIPEKIFNAAPRCKLSCSIEILIAD
jgi:hypothetical protein